MNKIELLKQALDNIVLEEVAISAEESAARRAERRIRRKSEKEQEKARHKRQRQIFLGKREKLYKSALKPILDDVKTKTQKQLREYDDIDFAWDVNPHFMNCFHYQSTGQEEDSQTRCQRSDPAELADHNLAFIEKFAGRKFDSLEEAQKFMQQDASNRPRPKLNREREDMTKQEMDVLSESLKFSGELNSILKRIGD